MLGRNDQARAAYGEALTLFIFKQVDDRLGQANVLAELGDLEGKLSRNDQARAAYGKALALFKQIDDRLGQALRARQARIPSLSRKSATSGALFL
jgi:Flp pilus assembly protein TadD